MKQIEDVWISTKVFAALMGREHDQILRAAKRLHQLYATSFPDRENEVSEEVNGERMIKGSEAYSFARWVPSSRSHEISKVSEYVSSIGYAWRDLDNCLATLERIGIDVNQKIKTQDGKKTIADAILGTDNQALVDSEFLK